MTYGTLDGTLPPKPNPPKPPIAEYDGDLTDYQYTPPAGGSLAGQPPPVPGGSEHPGKGVTAVSTEALRTFANNLKQLRQPLEDVKATLQTVDVKAGTFYDATVLADRVNDPKLAKGTLDYVFNAIEAITSTINAAEKMAAHYTNAEELNEASAKDVADFTNSMTSSVTQAATGGGGAP